MKTTKTHIKYIEWLSAEEMHDASKKWLSELKFIADEHLFFQDLLKNYTLQLVDKNAFPSTKAIMDAIKKSKKKNEDLIEAVKTHESDLQILVDEIDQIEEEKAYKDEHRGLVKLMSNYFIEYKSLKTDVFQLIKKAIKKQKQQRLS